MTQYDNTNRGQIWGNDKKESERHPDFKGDINVDGKEYWLSAWKRKPDANPKAPALSFSVQAKDAQQAQQAPQAQAAPSQAAPMDDFDDDIPF
jgi:single-stranded DNA-binding protein